MPSVTRRYPKEQFAQRGDAIYDKVIRPTYEPSHNGQFAAIDIETGEFEVDESEMVAGDRLRARLPQTQTWMCKIGSRYLRRFGYRVPRSSSLPGPRTLNRLMP